MTELEPTVLTNKQAGVILFTLRQALAKEEARLAYFGPDDPNSTYGSNLRKRLLEAIDIIDKRRETAEEMGG